MERSKNDGFEVVSVEEAAARADVIQILMPDETQARVFRESIQPNMKKAQL